MQSQRPTQKKESTYTLYVDNMGGTEETWKNACLLLSKLNPKTDSFEIYENVEQIEGEPTKFGKQIICHTVEKPKE